MVWNVQAPWDVYPSPTLCGLCLKVLRGRNGDADKKPFPTLTKDVNSTSVYLMLLKRNLWVSVKEIRSKDKILNVHHLESRKTGGDAPNNLITLCETCHKALHAGKIMLKVKRGKSFRAEAFMGIMRWTLLDRMRKAHSGLPVENTYGYLTKNTRIALGLPKTHCADAFCIAGNLKAQRSGVYLYQKQIRKHNRQIHKCSILKGGVRKLNQSPYLVKGFRLFDKVKCLGQVGFIFGKRSSGYFDVRTLGGKKLSPAIHVKKLMLLEKRKTFLTELRMENCASSPV